MLNTAAPFPHPGSYSLHGSRLVRIQYRKPDGEVLISWPGTRLASGNLTVPLAELADPTPLTADERAEYAALAAKLRRLRRPAKADRARYAALRDREINARLVDERLRAAGLDRIAA